MDKLDEAREEPTLPSGDWRWATHAWSSKPAKPGPMSRLQAWRESSNRVKSGFDDELSPDPIYAEDAEDAEQ